MAKNLENLEKRIAELEKKVAGFAGNKLVKISKSLGIGDTFELAGLTWRILDITDAGYKCLADKLVERTVFDSDCNDWRESDLREYLNGDFLKELESVIGADNIIPFERDLLSLDGQTEYGICEDKVSLLTVDEYRQYRKLIPNTNDYWWWLISPWSTPCNNIERSVAVVSSSGFIYGFDCNYDYGVRPFCIFSSSIFESEE